MYDPFKKDKQIYRCPSSRHKVIGPTVYRLASERRYGEIPAHVQSNPQDIYWADRYGSTALHVLCCSRQVGDPLLRAIESILRRDPTLVGQPNEATWTPLHLACEKRLLWRTNVTTTDLVLRLIEACPEAVSKRLENGYMAKTPFHIACETNASEEVLRAMLEINPHLAVQSYFKTKESYTMGRNPLQILWDILLKERRPADDFVKMEILLEAAFCGTVDEDPDFPIVCAACSIRCPRDYASRVLATHAPQIGRPAPSGWYPLHYAILSADESTAAYTSFLMERLLDEYPQAATIPFGRGKVLPLHALIADRAMMWHKGGVQELAMACTDVLRVPDPRSRLVPALESAISATQSRQHLSTTYELLRLAPEVVQASFSTAIMIAKNEADS